jgi:hypothetical protein
VTHHHPLKIFSDLRMSEILALPTGSPKTFFSALRHDRSLDALCPLTHDCCLLPKNGSNLYHKVPKTSGGELTEVRESLTHVFLSWFSSLGHSTCTERVVECFRFRGEADSCIVDSTRQRQLRKRLRVLSGRAGRSEPGRTGFRAPQTDMDPLRMVRGSCLPNQARCVNTRLRTRLLLTAQHCAA